VALPVPQGHTSDPLQGGARFVRIPNASFEFTEISKLEDQAQRDPRLELATLTLARYVAHSVFRRRRKRPLHQYFPPISRGTHADHAGVHAGH
jgi:hypothetical protein